MKILIVAAHPDDEVLGMGGTIARHAEAGDAVDIMFLTDGVGSRGAGRDAEITARRAAAQNAALQLGARPPAFHNLPDNALDSVPLLDIVQLVEQAVRQLRPDRVYTHHCGDLNVDHRIAQQSVLTACRPIAGSSVRSIHAFEIPSSTEWAGPQTTAFIPNRFVDISNTLGRKLAALAVYETETRPFPHPRSTEAVTALTRWRGASSGLAAAEAFMILRDVD